MNPKQAHYLVLEQLTGLSHALPTMRTRLATGAAAALAAGAAILATGVTSSDAVSLAIGVVLAGVPFGVFLQRLTLKTSLAREQLRLTRFMIGKKGYIAPKNPVRHHEADLFSIACSLVCAEPHLSPNNSAAAWHYFSMTDKAGVAGCSGWYGTDSRETVFLYGDTQVLLDTCEDIWDLGHIRKLSEADIQRYKTTAAVWKRAGLLPVVLAYAPLQNDIDPQHIELLKLRPHSSLLGMVGLSGSRGLGDTYDLDASATAQTAVHISLVNTVAITALSVGSVLANQLLQTPIGITLGQILGLKLFVEPIVLASLSWDGRYRTARRISHTLRSAMLAGLTIAGAAYAALVGYDRLQYALPASTRLQTGAAISLLTLGTCMLVYMWWIRPRTVNPLYILAMCSGLLGILIAAYATGPLLAAELFMGIGVGVVFLLVLELYSYSERHHSRDHILELIRSSTSH